MGITGLIPFLEKASSRVHLKDIRGCTVAVDTYCWLHKGVFSCAEKLVRGEDSDLYLQYCLKYVHLLLSYDIKPILVFDGRHLPAKALTECRRRESRQQSKKLAAELLREGRIEEARSHMRRCVDVTHEMALQLIRECRQRNVDCIVAPYEADAQMAWLNKVDLAQYVITEDSDLTLFGARKIIFKLDLTGGGLLVEADKLYLAMGCRQENYNHDKFRRMCIMSGCDYLDSLPGIGLAKACKFFLKNEEDNMWSALKKIPQYLKMQNLEVDDEYIDSFLKADATFQHMYIYNPLKRKMERLNEIDDLKTDERYCSNAGSLLENDEQAFQLALGNLNPFTLKQLDNWNPDKNFGLGQASTNKNIKRAKHKSIWQINFCPLSIDKEKNNITAGTSNCALYFKKVDFISKTLNEEINDSFKEEGAKAEESEIFTMYNEAKDHDSPQTKRRRCDSNSSSSSNDSKSPFVSPVVASQARHNPFAKACIPKTTCPTKSPVICESRSLLKALSPKKRKDEMMQRITRVNTLRRSIFNVDGDNGQQQVEVKSRFFASNLNQVTVRQTPSLPIPDFSEEINRIETLSQQNQANIAQLYNSPSPIKTSLLNEIPLSHTDSGIESIATDNTNEMELREDVDEHGESRANVMNVIQTAAESSKSSEEAVVILSDNDDDKSSSQSAKTFSVRLSQFATVKSKAKAPRLGLTKPKVKSNTFAKKSGTKSAKTASNSTTFSQNQTRLSMFGFQKRSSLK